MSLIFPNNPITMVLYLIVMIYVAPFFLQLACELCGEHIPTKSRSYAQFFIVGTTTFLSWNIMAFIVMNSFSENWIRQADDYSFLEWLVESFELKWDILGLVPGMHLLPLMVVVGMAGFMQVLILAIPYRRALVILGLQGGMTAAVLALFGALISVANIFPKVVPENPRLILLRDEVVPSIAKLKERFGGGMNPGNGDLAKLPDDGILNKLPGIIPELDGKGNVGRATTLPDIASAIGKDGVDIRNLIPKMTGQDGKGGLKKDALNPLQDVVNAYKNLDGKGTTKLPPIPPKKPASPSTEDVKRDPSPLTNDPMVSARPEPRRRPPARPESPGSDPEPRVTPPRPEPRPQPPPRPESPGSDPEPQVTPEASWDSYLDSVKHATAPVTDRLPNSLRQFLDGRGWWLIIGMLYIGTGFWAHSLYEMFRNANRTP